MYTAMMIEQIKKLAPEHQEEIIKLVRQVFYDGYAQGYKEGFFTGINKEGEE